jgi:hypothetical protein
MNDKEEKIKDLTLDLKIAILEKAIDRIKSHPANEETLLKYSKSLAILENNFEYSEDL